METFYAGGRVASAAVSILKSIAAAAVAMTLTTSAFANLVVNGGFETGNLTGWVELGNSSFTGVTCPGPGPTVFEGDCSAFSGPQGSPGSIAQAVVPTTAGQLYTISFWALFDGGTPSL